MQGETRKLVKKIVSTLMKAKTLNFPPPQLIQKGKPLEHPEETVVLKLEVTNPESPEVLELLNELGLVMSDTNNQQILKITCFRGKAEEDNPNQLEFDKDSDSGDPE